MPALRDARPLPWMAAALLALSHPAFTSPLEFVPVNDPIVAEWRVLDLYRPVPGTAGSTLPHAGSQPLQVGELLAPLAATGSAWPVAPRGPRGFATRRVLRALARDAAAGASPGGETWPRLYQRDWPATPVRLEFSAGAEGLRDFTSGDADPAHPDRWRDGSGMHLRTGVQVDRWLAYSHLFFGELHGVRAFSDALVNNTDIAASSEESYLAYTVTGAWSAQLGRDRWHWGPGEEGSLLLSRTSAPLTGLMLHARIEPLRADGFVFNATVEPGLGEQLAAHRIEWQPTDGARVGVSEAARYHAGGWQGVYLAGVIPYAVAQRLLDQDHRDSTGALRNNLMVSLDASVRVAEGSRIYGEVLLDDLHARTASIPNKWAWQAGWNGAGEVRGTRVSWSTEATRLSRYVYTSFFGRAYAAQDRPLGFPTGPGSRRLRARVTWDPTVDWQLEAIATRTETGTEGLADAFVPGAPVPDPGSFAGVVERDRVVEGTLRWWPASGLDLSVSAGRDRVENAGHVAGAARSGWRGTLAFRLVR